MVVSYQRIAPYVKRDARTNPRVARALRAVVATASRRTVVAQHRSFVRREPSASAVKRRNLNGSHVANRVGRRVVAVVARLANLTVSDAQTVRRVVSRVGHTRVVVE